MLGTHTSLRTTTSQVMAKGGGRGWRLVPYVGCRIDREETENHLPAWPPHSKVGTRPGTGEMSIFRRATRKLRHFNTDAVKGLQ